MSNGIKVSIAKIMIAIAPALRREAGQLLNAKVAEVRFITVVLSFACPAVVAWLSRCAILDAGGETFAGDNALGRMVPRNRVMAVPRPKRWAGFVTVHRAGQGMRSGQLGRGTRASALVMAGDAFVARVVSRDSKSGIGPGGRIAAFVPRLLRSHRNEENPSIGSAAMSLRLPDR
jgi:hypothetical protein